MREKVFQWIIFSLVLALFPIVFTALLFFMVDKKLDWIEIVKDGELFMITGSLIAPVIGSLILQNKKRLIKRQALTDQEKKIKARQKFGDIFIAGGLIFQLMASVGLFAGVKISEHLNKVSYTDRVMILSIGLIIGSSLSIISAIVRRNIRI